jgi:hypothetical protein
MPRSLMLNIMGFGIVIYVGFPRKGEGWMVLRHLSSFSPKTYAEYVTALKHIDFDYVK